MLHYLTVRPTRNPQEPRTKTTRKQTNRISARQVQNNLDAFIQEQRQFNQEQRQFNQEQRQVNQILLNFVTEQRQFNQTIVSRIDNLVAKNNLKE